MTETSILDILRDTKMLYLILLHIIATNYNWFTTNTKTIFQTYKRGLQIIYFFY